MRNRLLEAVLALLVAGTPASAAQVLVGDAWMRALPAGLPDAGYFRLRNGGSAVALTGAKSPACGMLMLHKSDSMNGMSDMKDISRIDIPAGALLKFEPGGYHLMCMNPTSAITPGARIPVTLQFSDGTKTTASFAVKDARGK